MEGELKTKHVVQDALSPFAWVCCSGITCALEAWKEEEGPVVSSLWWLWSTCQKIRSTMLPTVWIAVLLIHVCTEQEILSLLLNLIVIRVNAYLSIFTLLWITGHKSLRHNVHSYQKQVFTKNCGISIEFLLCLLQAHTLTDTSHTTTLKLKFHLNSWICTKI